MKIVPLDAEYKQKDALVSLVARTFATKEPTWSCLKVNPEGFFKKAMAGFVSSAAAGGLSFVAESDDNKLIAYCLAVDGGSVSPSSGALKTSFAHYLASFGGYLSTWFHPVPAIIYEVSKDHPPSMKKGECLEVAMVGTEDGSEGQGLAQKLIQEALNNAKSKGFVSARSSVSNAATYHITTRKLGFKDMKRVYYKDFRFYGKAKFAEIAEKHQFISLVQLDMKDDVPDLVPSSAGSSE